jgi:importin subunit beta-1
MSQAFSHALAFSLQSLALSPRCCGTLCAQGMQKNEEEDSVRLAATEALYNALEFAHSNFSNESERNYLMQVAPLHHHTPLCCPLHGIGSDRIGSEWNGCNHVQHLACLRSFAVERLQVICEGTKSNDVAVRKASFECFVKIAASYYDKLPPYIEAIFQLTSVAVRQDNEEVAKQAIEFWCSICEEETAIQEVRPFCLKVYLQGGGATSAGLMATISPSIVLEICAFSLSKRLAQVD